MRGEPILPEIQLEQAPHLGFIFNDQNRRHSYSVLIVLQESSSPSRDHQVSVRRCCILLVHCGKNMTKHAARRARAVVRVLDANRAMMPIHNLRNNRQSKPHSGLLRRHKWIENLLPQLRRNSRPGIGDPHFHSVDRFPLRTLCRALCALTLNSPPFVIIASYAF